MGDSRKISTPLLGLIWFAAAVSLAEMLTGTFFAPLGLGQGVAAILLGHLIGGVLFWLVSYVSAATGASAMQAVRRSFGRVGGSLFAGANVVQLVGWTAIMIASGAAAAEFLVPQLGFVGWALVMGALIVVWIAIGVKFMSRVQSAAAVLLFGLTVVASVAAASGGMPADAAGAQELSFGAAVELAAAMPLSWLPVVGDYTRLARRPLAGSLAAALAYTLGSCWMFAIGLGCALFAGSDDIAVVLGQTGLGAVGILIVVFSTVTTTFLDAQSAGESAQAIHPAADARVFGVAAAVLGCALAVFAPVGDFEDFLYLIGSVFAPLATIVCVDYLVGRHDASSLPVNWMNVVLWVLGFALYRASLAWDLPCGNTLPVMAAIAVAAAVANLARGASAKRGGSLA